MVNLLTYKESFLWEDAALIRSQSIRKLNEAILTSKEYGDSHYKTSDFNSLDVSWGNLMEFVFSYGFDEEQRAHRFPWMSQIEHTTLVNIFSSLKNANVFQSNSVKELDNEFGQNRNGLIGFEIEETVEKYISCKPTLNKFHSNYVSTLNRVERNQDNKYFIKHYVVSLKEDANTINSLIKRKQVNPLFGRLDIPKNGGLGQPLHGESFQIHFLDNKKSCLNINGLWKHEGFDLPNDVCDQLINWGFILPENAL